MITSQEIVEKFLSFFNIGQEDWSIDADARRKFIRHGNVHAEVKVGNYNYSVRDWSMGGISFETGPDASLTVGDKLTVNLTFRFLHDTVTVQHAVRVVRATRRTIAAEFMPAAGEVRRQFDRVLDSLHMQNFLESQAA